MLSKQKAAAKQKTQRNNYSKRRQKIPHQAQKNAKIKLHEAVVKQNSYRARIRTIGTKLALKPVREIGTGVDYKTTLRRGRRQKTITLDVKFSFGILGENTIAARVNKRQLINKADYALSIARNNKVHVFSIKQLSDYIKINYGNLAKNAKIDKGNHFVCPIKLNEFYAKMQVTPIIVELSATGLGQALNKIKEIELPEIKPTSNKNIKPNRIQTKKLITLNNQLQPIRQVIRRGVRGK